MKLSDLQRAIERARRLYATSATKPNEVFDDQDFTARRCMRAGCYGNHILAHPRRASSSLGPLVIFGAGGCQTCADYAAAWAVLDKAISPTQQRLEAGNRDELARAYGVLPELLASIEASYNHALTQQQLRAADDEGDDQWG
jgi:hypothetical protein